MPRCPRDAIVFAALLGAAVLLPGDHALAQQRTIRVIGDDGEPVAYANVTLAGERPRITDENGDVALGAAARPALTVDVRRLGYEPWYGTLSLGDTVTAVQVTLHRISRRMFTVNITDSSNVAQTFLRGFYERMLAHQRGVDGGIYLTPEEIGRRRTGTPSALLEGLGAVSLRRRGAGRVVVMSAAGACEMPILVDGRRACPENGCTAVSSSFPPPSAPPRAGGRSRRAASASAPPPPQDDRLVALDDVVTVNEVAAIEVYPRGASIPPSLPAPADASCGLIAVWTYAKPSR